MADTMTKTDRICDELAEKARLLCEDDYMGFLIADLADEIIALREQEQLQGDRS
jgi:hypothetical protein